MTKEMVAEGVSVVVPRLRKARERAQSPTPLVRLGGAEIPGAIRNCIRATQTCDSLQSFASGGHGS